MTSVIYQEVIIPDAKQQIMYMIERDALDNDGIIFGGAVRDTIISQEYAKRYRQYLRENKMRFNSKKFWDVSVHPETAARTLVPDDLDIYFDQVENVGKFLRSLQEKCNEEHIELRVEKTNDDPSTITRYGRFIDVQKVSLTMYIGKVPFISHGYELTINVDVVTPYYRVLIQPPFNNLDFLCNGFIKTKYGITYSKDTGTYIDALSDMERTVEILKIQQDMIQFKTNFCRYEKIRHRDIGTFSKNSYACKRIHKLLSKTEFPWTICNLPFEIVQTTESNLGQTCSICLSDLEEEESMAITSTLKEDVKIRTSVNHVHCLMSYLIKQNCEGEQVEMLSEKDPFVFKCPMRTTIDFTRCTCAYKTELPKI